MIDLPQGKFKSTFVIANVAQSLLGADFLRVHSILVDMKHQRVVNAQLFTSIPMEKVPGLSPQLNVLSLEQNAFAQLLAQFPQITTPHFCEKVAKHQTVHHIVTRGPPIHARPRRLSPIKLAIARDEFNNMLNMGIIRRSASPLTSPLHMMQKPAGGWRPCGDYRRLNSITEADRYAIPHIQDFSARLSGATMFSKVDLVRGYHQVPVDEEDVPKTAVITPFGLFEILRMSFGLKNAAQTFQRLMNSICQPFDSVFVYLDDILVASSTQAEHKKHLQLLFQRLADFDLVVNVDKCRFGRRRIEFIGHLIDQYGARPLPSKVEAVQAFPHPTTLQVLPRFAGMINFYHRFTPLAATIMAPIYQTIANKPKLLIWNETLKTAFQNAKCALANAAMLHLPKHHAPLTLSVDASDIAVGGVLQQIVDGQLQPLAFFSRKLRKPKTKYSTFDRELLAMHLAVHHFRYFLEGRHFVIFTDHKPLRFAFSKVSDAWSARQQRQLSAISEFTTDARHIAGKANLVADTLSRASLSMVVS